MTFPPLVAMDKRECLRRMAEDVGITLPPLVIMDSYESLRRICAASGVPMPSPLVLADTSAAIAQVQAAIEAGGEEPGGGGEPEPVFSANFISETYTGGAALDDFLKNFYSPETPLSEFVVQGDGLHPNEALDALSAKGPLLSAMADASGFTIVLYVNMASVTADKCLFDIFSDANGPGGAHSLANILSDAVNTDQYDGDSTNVGIVPVAISAGSVQRIALTFAPTESSISLNGAAVQTVGGVTRPYVYDRADIGNRDTSALFGQDDAILGLAVYAALDAATLPTLDPLPSL